MKPLPTPNFALRVLLNRLGLCLLALSLLTPLCYGQTEQTTTRQEKATEPARPVQKLSLQQLLEQVKKGQQLDRSVHQQRLAEFRSAQQNQAQRLNDLQAENQRAEAYSQVLEKEFDANQLKLAELQSLMDDRLGSMKELFGVLQQVSTETQAQFEHSLTQLQFSERSRFLIDFAARMGKTSQLPTLTDIERLWFELLRESGESGKIVRFNGEKVTTSGELVQTELVRIGLFNLVSDGRYLSYIPETGRATELARQPDHHLRATLAGLDDISASADGELADAELIAIDPTRGQLLSMLIHLPDLGEKVRQGGYIGYAIIALGLVAALIALERFISLTLVARRVEQQLQSDQPLDQNPLGRLLRTYDDYRHQDLETLELKLGERMLKEMPKLNTRLLIIKVVTVIAPLMGLLGTVTGLIFTFQSITLFGTGDPKLMAGGISQALVTTVLGLSVAIPGLLLHSIVSGKARAVSQVLEQQAAGMIAERALRQ